MTYQQFRVNKKSHQIQMELEEKLYNEVLEKRKVILDSSQEEKFRFACKKAIPENPGASYSDLFHACNIYLNFILSFPSLDLGGIKMPE